ncbi:hypothetical protein EMPG_16614, partial [Blastomyces silverae]
CHSPTNWQRFSLIVAVRHLAAQWPAQISANKLHRHRQIPLLNLSNLAEPYHNSPGDPAARDSLFDPCNWQLLNSPALRVCDLPRWLAPHQSLSFASRPHSSPNSYRSLS